MTVTTLEFPNVPIGLVKPREPVQVPLVESTIVTSEQSPNFVRHVTFDVSGTPLEGNLRAGQSFGIIPPGVDAAGKAHKLRLYSVSSPTAGEKGGGRLVSTLVKRVIEEDADTHRLYLGICSNYLCDLQVGELTNMTGPAGKRFLLPNEPRKFNYVFFATGTGIAPFRAMVLDLLAAGDINSNIYLIEGVPYRTDYLYHDLFNGAAGQLPGFHYRPVVSREDRRLDGFKRYVHHEIADDPSVRDILSEPNTLIYICGLKSMETAIYRELIRFGYSDYISFRSPDKLDLRDLDMDGIRKYARPGPRVAVEVY